ncbi:MAG: CoA pyrophosphatase [Pseudomonadota bacterium]
MGLSLDTVRAALAGHEPRTGDGDHAVGQSASPLTPRQVARPAGVLVPLVARAHDDISVILTQRSPDLSKHAGQVSFPGGRHDASDIDLTSTALREAEEEIGLARQSVTVIGSLNGYRTGTGYQITPVVGTVPLSFQPRPNPDEVADVFEVPLDILMDETNYELRSGHWKGARREYYALDYDNRFIWGATAGILIGMSRLVNAYVQDIRV